jgi:glycosyltransferase involved in cell wall biosynthesis
LDQTDPGSGAILPPLTAPDMKSSRFHHEIESKLLRADHGRLVFSGWCLAEGEAKSPAVRLTVGDDLHFAPGRRFARADVLRTYQAADTADPCGFAIEAQLDPGAHSAKLEATIDGGVWETLKRFIILATADQLQFGIEQPAPGKILDESTRVMGWCAHPDYSLKEVWLHYGTQRIRCTTGLPREDVPRFLPRSPDAARAGFISIKNLPVGRGPLRIKTLTADGGTFIADTGTLVDITRDEDHPQPFVHGDRRPDLGPARQDLLDTEPPRDPVSLHCLFVLFGDFTSNSAIHVTNLANQLAARGHSCTVAVPGNAETAKHFRTARFKASDYPGALQQAAAERFDIIHAWTTRENVRRFCEKIKALQPTARVVVHLEDNELRILEQSLGRSMTELSELGADQLDSLIPATLSHPRRSREFLEQADGVTVILDALKEHVPAGKSVHTIWPAADMRCYFPRPRPLAFRRALGWPDDHIVLFYHGNVHPANRAEVRELYAAVLHLNRQGHACTLIRLGRDSCDFLEEIAPLVVPYVMNLGLVEQHEHIPVLMSLADYYVQPGEADPFNDYRFPSKLPEFFALGRPVILPRTNLGLLVRHGTDGYVLDRADRGGIVGAILELERDPALRGRLAEGALAFAQSHFNWARSADQLHGFYRTLVKAFDRA